MDLNREVAEIENINKLADTVHSLAWEKGWHSKDENEDRFIERMCNNLHDEISELHEAWRNNRLHEPCDKPIKLTALEEEMADILIRLLDNARKLGVDIQRAVTIKHHYNSTRSFRHGGKRS